MTDWAQQQPDGTWRPCDAERNAEINAGLADWGVGGPNSAVVRDGTGTPHVITGMTYQALHLAVRALDASLRPDVGYRPEAPEIYAQLVDTAAMARLRRVFDVALPRTPE